MNPYQSYLGSRDPIQVMAATPERLAELVDTIGPARVEEPLAPGKWSIREILCHLADTELAFAFRLRQAVAEDHHVIQPYDQDRWAANYPGLEARAALAVFTAVRDWNVKFVEKIPRQEFSKRLTHPERGEMTFQMLVDTIAGHDLNHLQQLEKVARDG
jgi:hypothetical protein